MKTKIMFLTVALMVTLLAKGQIVPDSASVVLKNAYKQAATEKKNVMVVFHASWCGWCKKFEASINDSTCKDYFARSYVICELTIMESKGKENLNTPGAIDIYNKNGGSGGIPYFLIYNSKGKLLADSKMKPAGAKADDKPVNIGCPASAEEVAAFVEILRKTSKITDKEVTAVTERFKKNKS
ncbi:MAG: thioredoxin family protein [Bacteroidales bacterium]